MLAVIQARLNSQRLPGKALRMLGKKNILERTINRLKQSKKITTVVVATSTEKTDSQSQNMLKKSVLKFIGVSLKMSVIDY